MPTLYGPRKMNRGSWKQEDVDKAIKAMREEKIAIRATARTYNIPESSSKYIFRIKSPGSPEEGPPNVNHVTTPPSLSHVTSTLHSTPPPSSTLVLSPNNSNTGSSSPPATPGASRPNLGKLKRFLSTLVQFGAEISAELGDRVRTLVFNMVNGNITVEEFHTTLQEATNFPLRPFVLPFLRTHLPLLQRELSYQARIAKQSTSQYLRHHEQLVLDPSFSPSEASEIFNSEQTIENGKRKHSESIYENGITTSKDDQASSSEPQQKRERLQHSQPIPLLFNSTLNPLSTFQSFPTTGNQSFQFSGFNSHGNHQYTSGFNTGLLGPSFHLLNSVGHAPPPHLLTGGEYTHQDSTALRGKDDRSSDEEWKNINTMLNCILSMVEKTKRALSILQTRDRGTTTESDLKRAANEIIKITEDRIAEIKRRAEEAVNEVKRQAIVELERVVLKNNKSKDDSEDASQETQPGSQNLCWNCGRKAQETCSGCNIARYCGSYCQHRDWETHHQVCCSTERRHLSLGQSSRHATDERRHLATDDRRNVLDERRNFLEEQQGRRHSSEENRRHEEKKDEFNKRNDKEKEKNEAEKRSENFNDKIIDKTGENVRKYQVDIDRINDSNRNRLLPNISSQVINIDNIRRIKNHVLNRDGDDKSYSENSLKSSNNLAGFSAASSLRSNRCNSRSTTPVSATSSVSDAQLTK